MILYAAALMLAAASPTPPPVPLGLAAEHAHAREWSVTRPTRGLHGRTVALAAAPPHGWGPFAACVEDRESGGNPAVLNHAGSGAAGLFQLMPPWRHGGPYNARERLIRFGMPKAQAKAVRVYLSARPIHHWPAAYQRVVFAEALHDGIWQHWSLAGSRCNSLVPAGAR